MNFKRDCEIFSVSFFLYLFLFRNVFLETVPTSDWNYFYVYIISTKIICVRQFCISGAILKCHLFFTYSSRAASSNNNRTIGLIKVQTMVESKPKV